jgi:alpha-L-rhamnosidase
MRQLIPIILITANLHAESPTAPTGLLANGIENPQAIDVAPPSFSWIMNDADRGEIQTSYQILVSSSSSNTGDIWNSGKITSSQSSSLPYLGPALTPATRYWWSVKLWDKDNQESPSSTVCTFDTGLSKSDWNASFIWDGTSNENNFALFRKEFTINKPVKIAKVFTSAHNDSILHLNGTKLGYGPARSDPMTYGQYNAYDVTSQLVQGPNAFAALAHWHGVWNDSGTNASPAFLLECRITFTDGTTMVVKSDSSWKTQANTAFIETSPTYFGFYGGVRNRAAIRYDARNEIAGWTQASFDDSTWQNASVVDRSSYQLFAQRVADQVEDHELSPISLTKSGSDWVADYGKCITGWPQITLRNQAPGTVIRINYFQMADGSGGAGWDEYTCKGGIETWRADFGRHTSFKTLRLSGITGTPATNDFLAIVAHTKADVAGSFQCSNSLLNDIFEMSERSARQNIQQGVVSVDANREQSPWTADSHNIGIGLLYNHRNTLVLDKVLRDYAGEQMSDGRLWACSPTPIYEIPEWSMHWPMMLWQQYLFTGDKQIISDLWPNLVKLMTWADAYTQTSGLLDIPGWRIADYAGGVMENDGQNIALNSFYYGNLNVARDIATALGHTTEAASYKKRAENLKTAINSQLFNGTSYLSKVGSSQRIALGTAYALRFGLVPDQSKDQAIAWLRKQPANLGGYGGYTYYTGAYEAGGLGDLVVADLIRYQYMLAGNRTIWESFGRPSPDNETNHAWTAYPAHLLPHYIGGIAPTGPGFSNFSIKPETRGLTFGSATVPTVRGDITSRWERVSTTKLRLNCTIPANTTALLQVPLDGMKDVTIQESGSTLWTKGVPSNPLPGVTYQGADSRYVRFTVGSGTYSFTATGTAVSLPPLPVICDNDKPSVTLVGSWQNNSANETDQRYESSVEQAAAGNGSSTATFRPNLPASGRYKVYAHWTSHANRATNSPYTIYHAKGQETIRVNQEKNGGKWILLGEYDFTSGTSGYVVLTNDADGIVVADAVAFSPVAATLPPGASIDLLEDSFDTAENTYDVNQALASRQSGFLAPLTFRSNTNNGDWQSQLGNTTPNLLIASFPGQVPAGETLDLDLAPSCGGRLVIQFSLRCRSDNGNATRWASISLSDQPPSGTQFVSDDSNQPGILLRSNGGIQCFRPGLPTDSPSTLWTTNSGTTSNLKLVISDSSGTGSPFISNGSLARLYAEDNTLLAEWPLAQLHQGWLHLGAYESLWEFDNLRITTEFPGTDYQTWIQKFFPGASDPSVVDASADPDSDGLNNLSEYAFGLNPSNGASVNPIAAQLDRVSGRFSYTRRLAQLTALTYSIWFSTDLLNWAQDIGAKLGAPLVSDEMETVPVTISASLLSNPILFVQVRAE